MPHRLMQSTNLSIIYVRDLISGTKAELKKKKADDWTALVNFYESRELRRKASRFCYIEGKLVKAVQNQDLFVKYMINSRGSGSSSMLSIYM